MIVAEDWTESSCVGNSPLGVRVAGTKSCDGGFSTRVWEGVLQNEPHAYSDGLELAGSAPMNEIPGVVPHRVECIVWEQVEWR